MKPVFEISPEKIDVANCILICEVSNEGFAYLVKNDEANIAIALGVYHFNKTSLSENNTAGLKSIFAEQEILSRSFKQVYIIYSFTESVLIPFQQYDASKNGDVINLVYGDLAYNNEVLTDEINSLQIYNAYRVPSILLEELKKKFPSAIACHLYSALIKKSSGGSKLSVIFYPEKIVLMVEKDGKLLLVNSYNYRTAEDVSYILLNTCRQLEIENIPVEVSGLVEKDSPLYKDLYKYFKSVSFAPLPQGVSFTEEAATYPSHFFSYFFSVFS